ncbi:hypothetical protein HAX54_021953 [Datura stramonium]|uniref:Uncharacterized protein n=1 Tax=Datura stramonium TaxID=4076 RepID=A0ABS8S3L8_DATST|nr:hypothetical protein [Datura stramonium]
MFNSCSVSSHLGDECRFGGTEREKGWVSAEVELQVGPPEIGSLDGRSLPEISEKMMFREGREARGVMEIGFSIVFSLEAYEGSEGSKDEGRAMFKSVREGCGVEIGVLEKEFSKGVEESVASMATDLSVKMGSSFLMVLNGMKAET